MVRPSIPWIRTVRPSGIVRSLIALQYSPLKKIRPPSGPTASTTSARAPIMASGPVREPAIWARIPAVTTQRKKRAVVFRLGKFLSVKGPGLVLSAPLDLLSPSRLSRVSCLE